MKSYLVNCFLNGKDIIFATSMIHGISPMDAMKREYGSRGYTIKKVHMSERNPDIILTELNEQGKIPRFSRQNGYMIFKVSTEVTA